MQIDYKKRIFGLDLMRAAAILMVVFSHLLWIVPLESGLVKDLMSLAGVMGVELFFVLSGFLIGRIVYRLFVSNNFSKKQLFYFWVRRWFRTLPNYYLVLLLNVVLCVYLSRELPSQLWQYAFFLQNFMGEMSWFFPESWSLSIEEFAYIIGPLTLFLMVYYFRKKNRSSLFLISTLGILLLFLITKIIYNSANPETEMIFWNTHLKAVVIYRIDAIYYGMLFAYISIKKERLWVQFRMLFFLVGLSIFVLMNYWIPVKGIFIEQHPFFWNVLYLPLNSIAIAFCLPWLSTIKKGPKFISKPVTYISLISYSMYLLHYSIVMQVMKHYLPSEGLPMFDKLVYILVYLAITTVASYLLYRIFEKPIMNLRDSKWIKNKFGINN